MARGPAIWNEKYLQEVFFIARQLALDNLFA